MRRQEPIQEWRSGWHRLRAWGDMWPALGEICGKGSRREENGTEAGSEGSTCADVCFYCGIRLRRSSGEWAGCKAQKLRV